MRAAALCLTTAERNAVILYARNLRAGGIGDTGSAAVAAALGWRLAQHEGGGYRLPDGRSVHAGAVLAQAVAEEIGRIRKKLEAAAGAARERAARNGGAERRNAMSDSTKAPAESRGERIQRQLEEELAAVEGELTPLLSLRDRIREALKALSGEEAPDPAERLDEREEQVGPPPERKLEPAPEPEPEPGEERLDERERKVARAPRKRRRRRGVREHPTESELVAYLRREYGGGRSFKASEVREALGVESRQLVQVRCKALADRGVLVGEGAGSGRTYRLAGPQIAQPATEKPVGDRQHRVNAVVQDVRQMVTRAKGWREGEPFTPAELAAAVGFESSSDTVFRDAVNYWVSRGMLRREGAGRGTRLSYVRRVPDPHVGQRNGSGDEEPEGIGSEAPTRGRVVPGTGGKLVGALPR